MSREEILQRNLDWFLATIPEKDASLEIAEDASEGLIQLLRSLDSSVNDVALTFLQLSHHHPELDREFRQAARKMLQDFSVPLNAATRIFISDLLVKAPKTKVTQKQVLVRDVMIICALLIYREMGINPTKGVETKTTAVSGSQRIFEYLATKRGLEFADSAGTIQRIWSKRQERFDEIGLGHLADSK